MRADSPPPAEERLHLQQGPQGTGARGNQPPAVGKPARAVGTAALKAGRGSWNKPTEAGGVFCRPTREECQGMPR
jgi:hypothetical protein